MQVSSEAFKNNGWIPKKYSAEGENISPPLSWSQGPEGTAAYVLICEDPDAPMPEPFVHWILFNIPPDTTSLPRGSVRTGVGGLTSKGDTTYMGPMPPRGHGVHHYHFRVYALDAMLDLKSGATKKELLQAMEGRVLAEGELVGTYERK